MKIETVLMFGKKIEYTKKDTGEKREFYRFIDMTDGRSMEVFPNKETRITGVMREFSQCKVEMNLSSYGDKVNLQLVSVDFGK